MTAMILALDLGGTKFAVGVFDAAGSIVATDRVPTPYGRRADAEALWDALVTVTDRVLATAGVTRVEGIGAGCSGPMSWPEGVVSPLNIAAWQRFPLRPRLLERFGGVPVRLHNDAICAVVGEHWQGTGQGHDNMLGMVVSTGVGGGLILGGRAINGATGNAGHVGHIVVVPGGQECGCGGRGCLEAEVRGPRIAEWAVRLGWRPPAGTEEHPSARDLAEDARGGDPVAVEGFARAGRLLGLGIASAVAATDVDLVTIGGGIAASGDLLFGPLRLAYAEHAKIHFARDVTVVPASLDSKLADQQATAGLVGAAGLLLGGDRYWSAS